MSEGALESGTRAWEVAAVEASPVRAMEACPVRAMENSVHTIRLPKLGGPTACNLFLINQRYIHMTSSGLRSLKLQSSTLR